MHEVNAEGTTFYYFTQPEDIAQRTDFQLEVGIPDTSILSLIKESNDSRLVLFRSMLSPNRGHFYILYWNNGQNLTELDQQVVDGNYDDKKFKSSIKTVYQKTECDKCKQIWQTLVVPPGDPYPGAPGLLEEKIAASKLKLCPSCGASFRQMVVKVIGKA